MMFSRKLSRRIGLSLLLISLAAQSGCAVVRKSVLNYSEVKFPPNQVIHDIPYWASPNADPVKNRLDLFLPKGKNWPLLIFVHGGEWISGDKSLKVVGADIYQNIGRYFASKGIGTAVINYRLMPATDWKSQIMDVANAVNFLSTHIQKYHGDPKKIFLLGHSSGAQLSVRVALDPQPLHSLGSSPDILAGVIPVSGAGYDLTDEATYQLAQKDKLFEKLFNKGTIPYKLRKQMSPMRFVNGKAPPFLIFYAEKEDEELKKESKRLNDKLQKAGSFSEILEIPVEGHKTAVISLSNSTSVPANAILVFIKSMTKHH